VTDGDGQRARTERAAQNDACVRVGEPHRPAYRAQRAAASWLECAGVVARVTGRISRRTSPGLRRPSGQAAVAESVATLKSYNVEDFCTRILGLPRSEGDQDDPPPVGLGCPI
jgi:hypothetical protein